MGVSNQDNNNVDLPPQDRYSHGGPVRTGGGIECFEAILALAQIWIGKEHWKIGVSAL